ncbi:RHS repeat domain-containing protein [Vallitalea sp.]|uniref:RHS repeat domain-containing protein n=1 Tax=Vallitalea sp. TaxID=1882829 RepID=UPI0025D98FBE|nr:RHS repeat-associated core domain-containing protein [Vallitalea sp.]MCT4688517.1 RHS repeat-associated core domain-containing protein [Vallitalea sp.]
MLNINATIKYSNYEFHLKDHLGNTRVAVNENNIVTQTNNYYPFGLTFAQSGSSTNKYLYNGKELQEETGLLDFGARQLDKELGRWFNMDPKSEKYPFVSPYVFCLNNPIRVIDPDGKDVIVLGNSNGAGGVGHQAVLIGNNKGGWVYISKDGAAKSEDSRGPSRYTAKFFKTLDAFKNSHIILKQLMVVITRMLEVERMRIWFSN